MITPANRNAAVIIVNRRRDHEFVIIAPVLAYSMLFSVPRDGNHGLENAIFRPWKAENKELRSLFSIHGDGQLAYAIFWP